MKKTIRSFKIITILTLVFLQTACSQMAFETYPALNTASTTKEEQPVSILKQTSKEEDASLTNEDKDELFDLIQGNQNG